MRPTGNPFPIASEHRILLLGASRGLGHQVQQKLLQMGVVAINFSRSSQPSMDFSREDQWSHYLKMIEEQKPQRIFYFAGGGPFGSYFQKEWKDHLWSYRVNFLFPSFLLSSLKSLSGLQQMVFVGSSVAESSPDPNAASYAAGKAALWNLIRSIHAEDSARLDLRLFSPGYMNTRLLPPQAWPRKTPELVQSPEAVAARFLEFVQIQDDTQRHLVIGPANCDTLSVD